jgi:hypothetical protein
MSVMLDFRCNNDNCNHRQENVLSSGGEPVGEHPMHCGERMVIDWMTLPQSAQEFVAFDTRNITPDGKSVHVGSRGDLAFYAREYGVRHVDDPDLVAEGDQIVRKSRGVGKVFDFGGR